MIKKLRTKFIIVAMCSVFVVLFSIIATINIINYNNITAHADSVIAMLQDGQGTFNVPNGEVQKDAPEPPDNRQNFNRSNMPSETPFMTRYFTVELDSVGNVTKIQLDKIASINEDIAQQYVQSVINNNSGFYQNFRYGTIITEQNGKMFIFVDCMRELENFHTFLWTSLLVSAVGCLGVFLLVFFLSKQVFKPIEENYLKQKQFITNASHDIKTPLTIINANTDILESENGANEWTVGIKNEVKRLNSLTQDLVYLAKLDEQSCDIVKTNFNLSEVVNETIKSFEAVVLTHGCNLQIKIENNLNYFGNQNMIKQLVNLLLDNANKYADVTQPIIVCLDKVGNKIRFSIQNNHNQNLPDGDVSFLFDRFYRAEKSRNSQTGGHGIGLSVAQLIVMAHKGKIKAYNNHQVITFEIIF